MSSPTLSYLFTAVHSDGRIVEQDHDDKPKIKESGSAFSDVDLNTVVKFTLKNAHHSVSVDLTDGSFEVNGLPLIIHDQYFQPKDLRLIYFRETRAEQVIDSQGTQLATQHFVNRYFIGWQTTDKNGRNVQHTIAVGG